MEQSALKSLPDNNGIKLTLYSFIIATLFHCYAIPKRAHQITEMYNEQVSKIFRKRIKRWEDGIFGIQAIKARVDQCVFVHIYMQGTQ